LIRITWLSSTWVSVEIIVNSRDRIHSKWIDLDDVSPLVEAPQCLGR
jgi:hypothetical protein